MSVPKQGLLGEWWNRNRL